MTIPDNIIFLDIDGVLNNTASCSNGVEMLSEKVILLSGLIEATNAAIVLSTTWRYMYSRETFEAVFRILGGYGINILGATADLSTARGYEIQEWLDNNHWKRYIIIDDETDMLDHQLPYLMKTTEHVGLHALDIPDAIHCLVTGKPINDEDALRNIRENRKTHWETIYPALFVERN